MLKYLIFIFITACASWPQQKITHWNYQLKNYGPRFEKLLQMSEHAIWVIDINHQYFTNEKITYFIKQKQKKHNLFLAYVDLQTVNSKNILAISDRYLQLGIDGLYIKLEKNMTENSFQIIQQLHHKKFLIYVANAPYLIEKMSKDQRQQYFKAIDGIAVEAELFKLNNNLKKNKLRLDHIIQQYKKEHKHVLSVEHTVSLDMMEQYRKFVSKHDILGLVTDRSLRGTTFLHFVKN